jgi:uncharacterized membrane protein
MKALLAVVLVKAATPLTLEAAENAVHVLLVTIVLLVLTAVSNAMQASTLCLEPIVLAQSVHQARALMTKQDLLLVLLVLSDDILCWEIRLVVIVRQELTNLSRQVCQHA